MDALLPAHFAALPDPRAERGRSHPLRTFLTLVLCAVICGADSWLAIAQFGEVKRDWIAGFLDLPHGIPSNDNLWQPVYRP